MDWAKLLSETRVSKLMDDRNPSERPFEDLRSSFEQDYGRAVFSTPVRRLQDKAQVFPLEEHDAVRTRLTHSHEVSSVARGLGNIAQRIVEAKSTLQNRQQGCIPMIAATCGLVHDLGNPPFGHAGEAAISSWFDKRSRGFFDALVSKDIADEKERDAEARKSQQACDFLNFEGNAQTQRLLSRLQVLADENGLNLTAGTLSATCKYVAPSNGTDRLKPKDARRQPWKKHGYFMSEMSLIEAIRSETGTGDARNPIAFLVEAADDIVYATVDIEDGIKKKLLTWKDFYELICGKCDSKVLDPIVDLAKAKITGANLDGRALDESMAVAFRTFAIREMVIQVGRAFESSYGSVMDGTYSKEILYETEIGQVAAACKSIALEHIYSDPVVLKREIKGRKVIHDLLDLYWEAVSLTQQQQKKEFGGKIAKIISPNYWRIYENNLQSVTLPSDYFRMQLITDQVSGMTDSFAVALHKELCNG